MLQQLQSLKLLCQMVGLLYPVYSPRFLILPSLRCVWTVKRLFLASVTLALKAEQCSSIHVVKYLNINIFKDFQCVKFVLKVQVIHDKGFTNMQLNHEYSENFVPTNILLYTVFA